MKFEDEVIPPFDKMTKQYKIQLKSDGSLLVSNIIYHSDFHLMERYEIYEESVVEDIHVQVVIQHQVRRRHLPDNQQSLDMYYYEKDKTHEVRHIINYQTFSHLSFQQNHQDCVSSLQLVFDTNKTIVLPNCPIEIANWLGEYFKVPDHVQKCLF